MLDFLFQAPWPDGSRETSLDPHAVRAAMPDVTESEIFAAVRWAIRKSKRSGAKFERVLRGSGQPPRLKVVR